MDTLAWLVRWDSLGRACRVALLNAGPAQAWAERHGVRAVPLVLCPPGRNPDAWIVRYGSTLQHAAVFVDEWQAQNQAVALRGQRWPLMAGD